MSPKTTPSEAKLTAGMLRGLQRIELPLWSGQAWRSSHSAHPLKALAACFYEITLMS
jgi:hypothetical protein